MGSASDTLLDRAVFMALRHGRFATNHTHGVSAVKVRDQDWHVSTSPKTTISDTPAACKFGLLMFTNTSDVSL